MERRGQSGNVVLVLMGGIFLLGMIGSVAFLLSPSETDRGHRAAEEARVAYDEAVAALDRALNDPRNVQDSLDRNHSSFECLFKGSGDCAGKGGAFLLYDVSQARRPLSHLDREGGVDAYGNPCKGFPSTSCPLHVETIWEPVCNGARCENTKSLRVKARVTLAPMIDKAVPTEWTREAMFTPEIRLSAAASCERGGGVWAQSECLTPTQDAERRLAGGRNVRTEAVQATQPEPPRDDRVPEPQETPVYHCPSQIVVQGQHYPVLWLSHDRGQVAVPSMGCQVGNQQDVFVFQCAAKPGVGGERVPASGSEGQWIQVEAVMAPPCDQSGRPIGDGQRY